MADTAVAVRGQSRAEFISLIAAIMALNALAIDVMLPALPYMGEALGIASENERQFVVGAYMIGFGVAQLFFGPISDRFGRRGPLFAGIALYVVCVALASFAPTFGLVLALRFVQGIGAAATRVVATSVVRDRFSGRDMAQVLALVFMTFMVIPIIAPGIGQLILLVGPWHNIFLFMAGLATVIGIWAWYRLPETLHAEYRRPLKASVIIEGFRLVFTNRSAFFYGLAGMFLFGAMFGFISSSQQVFVDIYGLGPYFPVAFAGIASVMAVSQFINSRLVKQLGTRRVAHFAVIVYVCGALVMLGFSLAGYLPFPLFVGIVLVIQFVFGWCTSNMNSLSMEPLGPVAGTAAAVFGSLQTVGGAIIGTITGQSFNGTLTPIAIGYAVLGTLALCCALVAEKGKLFGVSPQYAQPTQQAPEPAH